MAKQINKKGNNRFKRIWPVVLAFLILAGCVGACQDSDETDDDKSLRSAPAVSSSEVRSDPIVDNETEQDESEDLPEQDLPVDEQPSEEEPIVSGDDEDTATVLLTSPSIDIAEIPAYVDDPWIELNGNQPFFTEEELTTKAFELYSDLDSLGRCGTAYANVCTEIMPTENRGSINSVTPTGWHDDQYEFVDEKNLYNRCHLIGFQLTGENANENNLITGTRYLNTQGMLPIENLVSNYVLETENHVLYRVTPVFVGDELVARGVLIEALSIEDDGKGICLCVYAYNVQPGVQIDYLTGDNWLDEAAVTDPNETQANNDNNQNQSQDEAVLRGMPDDGETSDDTEEKTETYILNTNTKKIHWPNCSSVGKMKEKNKKEYTGNIDDLINQGYSPCKICNPH